MMDSPVLLSCTDRKIILQMSAPETIRRIIRQIWATVAILFEVSQSSPCEELSQGLEEMSYGLLSRNFWTATLASLMEAHGYDGAIVLGVCDKMMVGTLRALIEADLARQRRKSRPVFATLIPSQIGRENHITDEDRRKFDSLRHRLSQTERAELDNLLQPMKPLRLCASQIDPRSVLPSPDRSGKRKG